MVSDSKNGRPRLLRLLISQKSAVCEVNFIRHTSPRKTHSVPVIFVFFVNYCCTCTVLPAVSYYKRAYYCSSTSTMQIVFYMEKTNSNFGAPRAYSHSHQIRLLRQYPRFSFPHRIAPATVRLVAALPLLPCAPCFCCA